MYTYYSETFELLFSDFYRKKEKKASSQIKTLKSLFMFDQTFINLLNVREDNSKGAFAVHFKGKINEYKMLSVQIFK